ncbi:3695_t:CDS:2 [Diversispora eburnea]|uniref:3695_t:CDS:1 n=1 Tax=Diversispora eburnea TaxID=1213867 RepID=A0A9N8W3R6_9GLOM|nr:3695_t:CDS:2 [Diversispora eburnea]
MTTQASSNPQVSSQRDKIPRDSKVMELILRSAGVEEFEPKVVQQLLEFAHRYTIDVIQDASAYAEHTGKNEMDIDDVKLAIQGRINHSFIAPPKQELAKEQNKEPLPPVPLKYGLRLPPDRHCLTAINFQLIPEHNNTTFSRLEGNNETSRSLPTEKDVMTGVQPTSNETDYDMQDVEETQDPEVKMNAGYKRPAEDDEYDDF